MIKSKYSIIKILEQAYDDTEAQNINKDESSIIDLQIKNIDDKIKLLQKEKQDLINKKNNKKLGGV
jgi:hypothetical protein